MQAPTLTDGEDPDRITLRPHGPDDVDAVRALWSDEQVRRWARVPFGPEREHAERFVAERAEAWDADRSWTLAVEAVDDAGQARFAGQVQLRPLGGGGAELGYALAPWARGRGVVSRAVRLLLDWGFTDAADGGGGLDVVQWWSQVGNWGARRVAWACGIRVEGAVRGYAEHEGARHDAWVGSVVRGDDLAPTGPWLEAVPITGHQVVLRPWREDDAARVAEACSDPVTQHWLPGLPTPYTLADAQWYLRSREEEHARANGIYWCVADPDDDRCLGAVSVMELQGQLVEPEVGYWMHPAERGRGVMTEAARLVVRHVVLPVEDGGLGYDRVVLRAAEGNAASRAIAAAAGMREIGRARRLDRLGNGTREDLVLHEVLADEVQPLG
ncbi:hypothetical protein GCM10027446_14510 [Angustibacter peucedani]